MRHGAIGLRQTFVPDLVRFHEVKLAVNNSESILHWIVPLFVYSNRSAGVVIVRIYPDAFERGVDKSRIRPIANADFREAREVGRGLIGEVGLLLQLGQIQKTVHAPR